MKKLILLSVLFAMFVYSKGEETTIAHYLKNVYVGNAIEYKNLKIFPLIAKKTLSLPSRAFHSPGYSGGIST